MPITLKQRALSALVAKTHSKNRVNNASLQVSILAKKQSILEVMLKGKVPTPEEIDLVRPDIVNLQFKYQLAEVRARRAQLKEQTRYAELDQAEISARNDYSDWCEEQAELPKRKPGRPKLAPVPVQLNDVAARQRVQQLIEDEIRQTPIPEVTR
jgi:hypothetical protein